MTSTTCAFFSFCIVACVWLGVVPADVKLMAGGVAFVISCVGLIAVPLERIARAVGWQNRILAAVKECEGQS